MIPTEKEYQTFTISEQNAGLRLDKFLTEQFPDQTRTHLQGWIAKGCVLLQTKTISKNYKLRLGDQITVLVPKAVELDILPENLPIDIVYADNDLLVVNKQKGMVVHPAPGNYQGTLVNALLFHCGDSLSGINGIIRPGIVHRIDKNTSGLLMIAKNDRAHQKLAEQIQEHSFLREYQAVVYGHMKETTGTVNAPIGRSKSDRKKMCITEQNSKYAVTHYEVIRQYDGFSHLKFRLETGRTHQIRVHMAYLGHPIAVDYVYGPKKVIARLNGQCLHAKKIGFTHPTTHQWMEFDTELPNYFIEFLKTLKPMRNL